MIKTILFIDSPSFGKLDMIEAMKEKGLEVELFYHDNIFSYPNDIDFDKAFDDMFVKKNYLFVFSFNYFPSVSNGCKRHNIKYLAFVYDNPLTSLYSYTIINSVNHVFIFDRHSYEELAKLGNGRSFGICSEVKDGKTFTYAAAYDCRDAQKAAELGLSVMHIPEAEYAVVQLKGPVPNCIHQGWKYVMETFFPEQGYCHAGTPDFEAYSEGDMYSKNYMMELWVPIVKA